MIDYDAELRRHQQLLQRALDARRRDRVLDVGCGTGQTTREAALIATDGGVLGIDTAEHAIRDARQLTLAAGLRNVDYLCGDAARHPFPPESIDVAISRFGTMFFADPVAAFTNIRGALRPSGRLVMMVWQAARHNEWAVSIHRALAGDDAALPVTASGPSAFSLGDASTVESILEAAAFADVSFEDVREPVYYGADVERAMGFIRRTTASGSTRARGSSRRAAALSRRRRDSAATAGRQRNGPTTSRRSCSEALLW